jgi:hypothetical protein
LNESAGQLPQSCMKAMTAMTAKRKRMRMSQTRKRKTAPRKEPERVWITYRNRPQDQPCGSLRTQ